MTQSPSTFVLVHGAWCGGWIWREVEDLLRAKGHRVFAPTLTGLCERSHLLTKDTNLETHVLDIANLIKWEELTDIVLVGHSYGGMVISGVAERVPEGTIRSIVYLDALYIEKGDAWPPSEQPMEGMPQPVELPGGIQAMKPPSPALFGIQATPAQRMERLLTPMPIAAMMSMPPPTGAATRIPKKTYVTVTRATPSFLLAIAEKRKADPAWHIETMDCGHCTMVDMPKETAEVLLRSA